MAQQSNFIQKNKNPNTGREDLYTFNPTAYKNNMPSYATKENAYGNYSTSAKEQTAYANDISNSNNWNENLRKVAQEISSGTQANKVQTGQQSKNTQNAYNNTNQTLNNMSNTLKTQPQQRNIQEGYTVSDLNKMAENGFNTLNEGYQNALNKAAANYNRLGLRGSGFEIADEFGNQSDSITSNYLKNVQQLQNDIATKGLEAAREDRYRNADANDSNYQNWIQNQGNLTQLQQNYADNQNKNELSWLQNLQDVGFKNNEQDLEWQKNRQSVDTANKDYMLKAIDTQRGLAGQSDDQQRSWATINGNLAANDDKTIMDRWDKAYDMDKTNIANQYEIYKAMLQNLGLATTGDPSNYNAFVSTMNSYPEWLTGILNAAGMNVPTQQ